MPRSARVVFAIVALTATFGDACRTARSTNCSAGPYVPACASVLDRIPSKRFFWKSFDTECSGSGDVPPHPPPSPPPSPPLLPWSGSRNPHNRVACSKQKLPSTQLAVKSLIYSVATPMKSFSQAAGAKAPTMPFEACALCKSSVEAHALLFLIFWQPPQMPHCYDSI
jgi:hypothetical protein